MPHKFNMPVDVIALPMFAPIPVFNIDGKRYRVVKANSKYDFLVTEEGDESRQLWSYICIPDEMRNKSCHEFCDEMRGSALTRRHFFCLFCPLKRYLQGKRSKLLPVRAFLLTRDDSPNRPGKRWKNWVSSQFTSLAEFFSRW